MSAVENSDTRVAKLFAGIVAEAKAEEAKKLADELVDKLNLAQECVKFGNWSGSESIIREMRRDHPDDFRVLVVLSQMGMRRVQSIIRKLG